MRVLVVDDSKTIRWVISSALEELGVPEIVEAESADAALALLPETPVDLIVTDWHMPGMSGLDFVKHLRGDPKFRHLPVIMSTSETHGDNVVAALQVGVTNYLIKPFNKQQFFDKVGPVVKMLLAEEAAKSPPPPAASPSHSGSLHKAELGDVLQFFMNARKTGYFEVASLDGSGTIYFEDGNIRGAKYKTYEGEIAFFRCFGAAVSSYRFHECAVDIPASCKIEKSSRGLLLDAAAFSDLGGFG